MTLEVRFKKSCKADLGLRIGRFRKAAGWSLRKAAREIGISDKFLRDVEQGNSVPTYTTIIKFCQAFDCQPMFLTDGDVDYGLVVEKLEEARRQGYV